MTPQTAPSKNSYAVVWSGEHGVGSGRLEVFADRFELHGRDRSFTIPFADLAGAAIARRQRDRLRGLPVLVLRPRNSAHIRIASLQGPGILHELAQHVEHAGLTVAA